MKFIETSLVSTGHIIKMASTPIYMPISMINATKNFFSRTIGQGQILYGRNEKQNNKNNLKK